MEGSEKQASTFAVASEATPGSGLVSEPGSIPAPRHPRLAAALGALKTVLVSVTFPILLVLVWHIVSNSGTVSTLVLPTTQSVWANFVSQAQSGQLLNDLLSSLYCVLIGYAVGSVLGIALGVVCGLFPDFHRFFGLLFDGVRQVPPIAWLPFIILWFGIGNTAKIVLVAFGTFFPVLINTEDGVRNTDRSYTDLIRIYHVKPFDVLTKVYLPSAMPFLLTGLKLGASRAWMSVVAAEMMGAVSGLGYRIANAQQLMRADIMVVDVIAIGIMGWLINYVLEKVTARASAWKND